MRLINGLRCILLCISAFLLLGWELPSPYKTVEYEREVGRVVDHFVVEINGETKMLKNESEMKFVRGDLIKIRSVALQDPKQSAEIVNVLGFKKGLSGNEEDRDVLIDTSTELIARQWALDPNGTVYAVVAVSKKRILGQVFLSRIEPKLSYVDIMVNNKVRVMREGEPLKVKASDEFKVSRIITNLADDQGIKFQAVLEPTDENEQDPKKFEILVSNKNYIFAKIPLHVEGL